MASQPQGQGNADKRGRTLDVPSVEDADLDDHTVASAALGYGLKRADLNEDAKQPVGKEEAATNEYQHGAHADERDQERLSHNEVAAVSMDRKFYVSDVPSPYLSSRQANEDVRETKRRHTTLVTIIKLSFVVVVLGVSGWFLWDALKGQSIGDVTQYETATIERGEFLETITTSSLVRPVDERTVACELSGTVAEILVQDGVNVNAGDVVVRLDNPTVTDAFNRARESLTAAQADVDAKQRSLDEAKAAVVVAQAVVDGTRPTEEAPTDHPEDAATSQPNGEDPASQASAAAAQNAATVYAQAQSMLASAQARETAAQVELDAANVTLQTITETLARAQEQQDKLLVRSPIAGTVNAVNGDVMLATPIASGTRLCIVSDLSRYRVQVEIPADQRLRVSEGREVRLTFPDHPDLVLTSTVASIEDSDSLHVANVYVEPGVERVQNGVAVQASVILQSIPDSLIVPIDTVQIGQDGMTYLDVLLDPSRGIDSNIQVQVLATNGTQAAIRADNIQAGNSVIVPVHDEQ